jgi:hypothetical protein
MTERIEDRLRRTLLLLVALVFPGTVAELILEEHTKETLQWIPFILCAAGFMVVIAVLLRPERATLLALRVVMVIVAGGGLLGMGLHLLNNYEFAHEIRPNAASTDLILPALKGANPLFAPGILVFAAVVALAATYYHPALRRPSGREPER